MGKEVILTGSTLLNEKGTYSTSLNSQETTLLQILHGDKSDFYLTLPVIKGKEENAIERNMLSFNAHDVKVKIHPGYSHDKFRFDIHVNMYMEVMERLFPFDMRKNTDKLEQLVEEQLKMQLGDFIKKIQKNKIDPIGLGIYARAYQNRYYEQVQNHWGKALEEATINISVDVTTRSMGSIK
ncbi:Ger(x)C family spore germination C-terminal domain-containing protein [Ectobacillus funiculus]